MDEKYTAHANKAESTAIYTTAKIILAAFALGLIIFESAIFRTAYLHIF